MGPDPTLPIALPLMGGRRGGPQGPVFYCTFAPAPQPPEPLPPRIRIPVLEISVSGSGTNAGLVEEKI